MTNKTTKFSKCATLFSIILLIFVSACQQKYTVGTRESGENDKYDGPALAAQFEFDRTKDPATGKIPVGKYWQAVQQTAASKTASAFAPTPASSFGAGWVERGPNSDIAGPSNGNTRANSGIPSGRVRAMLVDAADATKKTVWIGGVDGGLWKTTDITASPATWTLVNDYLSNLAIADIAQQPGSPSNMYFCTGEGYFNIDAVGGNGIFKSTDGGVTWAQVASTAGWSANRILVDAAGNIYLGTAAAGAFVATGIRRSTDGGATWTTITPTGSSGRIADMELSSTGRLHITTGLGTSTIGLYRFTDIPATVTSATWTAATTAFPYPSGANCRVELGCNGSILYALPSNTSAEVATIYKSTDGGANWAATATQPTAGWASGQAWYALAVDIDPSDPTNGCIVGGLDTWKTTDGGTTWTQISHWVGVTPGYQYVHADVQKILWFDAGSKLLFASDGGIFYSADKGITIRDRNVGLRIKQFYSCAIHPSTTNYFLAGAQDNGTHQFSIAGLSSTVEVKGGDGAFVAIDQDEPSYQFGSYVFNQYRRSTDGGTSWSNVDFSASAGQFINPFDYDNTANIMYCGDIASNYRRWTNPQTGSTNAVVNITSIVGSVTAVSVSPYTANKVFFGTSSGRVVQVDGANTIASGSAGTDRSTGLPAGTVSCINFGTDDLNLIMCESNYGISNVWVSTNGGVSWTSLDNNGVNLPDMPVRWCMFYPGDNTRALLATETGVWETDLISGTSTVWVVNTSFPTVRTDMLKYRSSDGTLAAATHGRGLWTNTINDMRTADFRTKATGSYSTTTNWEFNTYGAVYIDAKAVPGANNNVTVQSGHTLALDAAHVVNTGKTFTVNGTLNCGTNTISGAGSFVTTAASTLGIGSTAGITSSGATGNIQTTTRTFATTGNYNYNGAANQAAGNGLPATVNNLTVNNTGAALSNIVTLGANLAVGGTTTLTAGILSIGANSLTLTGGVSGSGTFTGSSGSNMVVAGTVGTLNFTQTSAATRSLNNLTLNAGSSATLGNALDVYGTIALTTATLDLNAKNLTLKSDATNTARVANLTGSTLSGATNVTMERYIKLRSGGTGRAYRLLAPTVNTTGTIRANWMEGGMNTVLGTNVNLVPLFGTHITGALGNTNGFDVTQNNQASIYATTNAVTPTYTAIGSTITGAGLTLNALTGYFLFVRGDRSMNIFLPPAPAMPTSSTTLRTTGTLQTGTKTSFTNPLIGGAGALNLITNPYPSPIDWSLVQPACTGVTGSYTYWDANIGTRGGFATVTTGGVSTPATSATKFIQSGQAFFVEASGAGAPTVSIQESHKVAGNNNAVFKPAGTPPESFRTELYFTEPDGYRRVADGVIALYDNTYSAGIDGDDASEINNWDENIAIEKTGKHLAIESRPVIGIRDTMRLFMNNMQQREYQFEFSPASFSNKALKAELIDNFLGTRTLLSVVDTVTVSFAVTSNPASSAPNRFLVVFGPASPYPIDVLTISAAARSNGIQVDWMAKTEIDMDRYELERSFSGTGFNRINTTTAVGNSQVALTYNWLDPMPLLGSNYYRIKAINKSGVVKYTDMVKVSFGKANPDITVFPNPVTGQNISIQLTDIEKGTYNVSIINKLGQVVYQSQVQHAGGSAIIAVTPVTGLALGLYEIVFEKDKQRIRKTFIKN
jgi:hypothetical protein